MLRWLKRIVRAERFHGILNDAQITKLVERYNTIEPFVPCKVSKGVNASYGLEPFGYTFRLGEVRQIGLMHTLSREGLRTEAALTRMEVPPNENGILLPPLTIAVCRSLEFFRLPDFVTGLLFGKSSFTRAGLCYLMTVVDGGFCGHITFTIVNLSPLNIEIYPNEGIGQIVFLAGEQPNKPYEGRYNGTVGIVSPLLNKAR